MKWKFDWFLFGMVAAVAVAWVFPEPGATGGWMQPELLTKAGVSLIFFLHGLLLSFAALREGTLRWPVHLAVQGSTFLLFPLLGLALLAGLGTTVSPELKLGIFFLCALPSTVSSSVALTATARGNVPVAVFNATLSNLLGVVLTPLWIGVVITATGQALPLGEVLVDLLTWLVLPLVVGQVARPWFGAWATRHKPMVNRVDRGVILLLVYTSFCDSVQRGIWTDYGWEIIAIVLGVSLALFGLVMGFTRGLSRTLKFSRADEIATMFCGSKKTLAAGVPMAQLIFGAHPGLGLILLPIMIYHPLQLILCTALAGKWARRSGK